MRVGGDGVDAAHERAVVAVHGRAQVDEDAHGVQLEGAAAPCCGFVGAQDAGLASVSLYSWSCIMVEWTYEIGVGDGYVLNLVRACLLQHLVGEDIPRVNVAADGSFSVVGGHLCWLWVCGMLLVVDFP